MFDDEDNKIKEEMIENMKKNFSIEEIAQMTSILSLYQPLLNSARMLTMEIIVLNELKNSTITGELAKTATLWNTEFEGLNQRLKAFNDKETIH